ncbi:hypothetical protein R3L02_42545 [Streptomyces scabiei]|uniref:hypothetical protein n=1 Tax=Streptomyces scabiei TaxID=1930 RepID=UPI00298F1499|nr:hypothetical protein [Streptomyces scabiei]MDW8478428.1 hypothetical protein [Streptomyces scabiei]
MVLTLFNRARRAPAEPPASELWPELGETWMPEGVTVVERHWNQAMSAIVLVYSAGASDCHIVACLGCHFSVEQDPDRGHLGRLKLTDANRIATQHATSCRALPRAIPTARTTTAPANSYTSGCSVGRARPTTRRSCSATSTSTG